MQVAVDVFFVNLPWSCSLNDTKKFIAPHKKKQMEM